MHIHLFTFMQIFFYFFDNTRTIPSCPISLAFYIAGPDRDLDLAFPRFCLQLFKTPLQEVISFITGETY